MLESIVIEKDTSTSGSAIKDRITAAVVSTKKDMAMLQADSAFSSAGEIVNQKQKVSHQLQQEKMLSNTTTKLNTTDATGLTAVIPREEESALSSFAEIQFQKETAVVISTHLIPSHPSLALLLEVLDSVRTYLVGLPEKCPIFITVDGIQEKYAESKEDNLFLSADKSNREKYDSYIRALHRHFKDEDNVKILIAGKNIGLAENLRRVVENLHPSTKYMYLMQHDLPFAKEINHTAIVKTANEHPEINIVRFNFKKSIAKPNECSGVPEINANGISLKKWIKWSDQNQFARVSHYVNDIFPILTHHTFPEMKMIEMAYRNCTHYGLYYYAKGSGGPWYKHTDATERYGSKLAERVKRGELDVSALSDANLREMRRAGVNITELFHVSKTTRE